MIKNLYLSGPDGAGKSTLLEAVKEVLAQKGITLTTVWLRSPKILSKPLMAYCRLMGYTKYFMVNGVRYGYHNFSASKFVSYLFPLLQYIDLRILLFLRKQPKGIVLYDRFVLDTLADLMVSTRRMGLHKTFIGRAFLRLMPSDASIFMVMVDEEKIRKRKQDTLHDPNLRIKLEVYKILATDLNIEILNNNGDLESTLAEIKNKYFSINGWMA